MEDDHKILLKQLEAVSKCPVRGHIRYLDDKRLVFVGQDPANQETYYLGFRSKDGEDTKLALSKEAFEALRDLLTEPFKGKRVRFPYVVTSTWQVTEIKP